MFPPAAHRRPHPLRAPAELRRAAAWVFDLDNTLYPPACDLFDQVDVRMKEFIACFLGVDPEEAFRVQKRYFREHGTTLRGLMANHGMAPEPFLDYVHDVDLATVPASPRLSGALGRLPGRKLLFTNASAAYAGRVLDRLGITHHFEVLFDIAAAGYVPKPEPVIYHQLVAEHGLDPRRTVMVEDMARNLVPAADLGMTTVWVRTDTPWGREGLGDHVHHVVDDLVGWLEAVAAAA
jgi:putative hydrolase of the HAD superfamily